MSTPDAEEEALKALSAATPAGQSLPVPAGATLGALQQSWYQSLPRDKQMDYHRSYAQRAREHQQRQLSDAVRHMREQEASARNAKADYRQLKRRNAERHARAAAIAAIGGPSASAAAAAGASAASDADAAVAAAEAPAARPAFSFASTAVARAALAASAIPRDNATQAQRSAQALFLNDWHASRSTAAAAAAAANAASARASADAADDNVDDVLQLRKPNAAAAASVSPTAGASAVSASATANAKLNSGSSGSGSAGNGYLTAAFVAATGGHHRTLRQLVESGLVSANARHPATGESLLSVAVRFSDDAVQVLLSANADARDVAIVPPRKADAPPRPSDDEIGLPPALYRAPSTGASSSAARMGGGTKRARSGDADDDDHKGTDTKVDANAALHAAPAAAATEQKHSELTTRPGAGAVVAQLPPRPRRRAGPAALAPPAVSPGTSDIHVAAMQQRINAAREGRLAVVPPEVDSAGRRRYCYCRTADAPQLQPLPTTDAEWQQVTERLARPPTTTDPFVGTVVCRRCNEPYHRRCARMYVAYTNWPAGQERDRDAAFVCEYCMALTAHWFDPERARDTESYPLMPHPHDTTPNAYATRALVVNYGAPQRPQRPEPAGADTAAAADDHRTRLGECPNVARAVASVPAMDPAIRTLNRALFGRAGMSSNRKRSVLAFRGFAPSARVAALRRVHQTLRGVDLPLLHRIAQILDVPTTPDATEQVQRIAAFLERPEASVRPYSFAAQDTKAKVSSARAAANADPPDAADDDDDDEHDSGDAADTKQFAAAAGAVGVATAAGAAAGAGTGAASVAASASAAGASSSDPAPAPAPASASASASDASASASASAVGRDGPSASWQTQHDAAQREIGRVFPTALASACQAVLTRLRVDATPLAQHLLRALGALGDPQQLGHTVSADPAMAHSIGLTVVHDALELAARGEPFESAPALRALDLLQHMQRLETAQRHPHPQPQPQPQYAQLQSLFQGQPQLQQLQQQQQQQQQPPVRRVRGRGGAVALRGGRGFVVAAAAAGRAPFGRGGVAGGPGQGQTGLFPPPGPPPPAFAPLAPHSSAAAGPAGALQLNGGMSGLGGLGGVGGGGGGAFMQLHDPLAAALDRMGVDGAVDACNAPLPVSVLDVAVHYQRWGAALLLLTHAESLDGFVLAGHVLCFALAGRSDLLQHLAARQVQSGFDLNALWAIDAPRTVAELVQRHAFNAPLKPDATVRAGAGLHVKPSALSRFASSPHALLRLLDADALASGADAPRHLFDLLVPSSNALHLAAAHATAACAGRLWADACMNASAPDRVGFTPLMRALRARNSRTVEALVTPPTDEGLAIARVASGGIPAAALVTRAEMQYALDQLHRTDLESMACYTALIACLPDRSPLLTLRTTHAYIKPKARRPDHNPFAPPGPSDDADSDDDDSGAPAAHTLPSACSYNGLGAVLSFCPNPEFVASVVSVAVRLHQDVTVPALCHPRDAHRYIHPSLSPSAAAADAAVTKATEDSRMIDDVDRKADSQPTTAAVAFAAPAAEPTPMADDVDANTKAFRERSALQLLCERFAEADVVIARLIEAGAQPDAECLASVSRASTLASLLRLLAFPALRNDTAAVDGALAACTHPVMAAQLIVSSKPSRQWVQHWFNRAVLTVPFVASVVDPIFYALKDDGGVELDVVLPVAVGPADAVRVPGAPAAASLVVLCARSPSHTDALAYLCGKGASVLWRGGPYVHARDGISGGGPAIVDDGYTGAPLVECLHVAATAHHPNLIRNAVLLLEFGASWTDVDPRTGATCLELALGLGRDDDLTRLLAASEVGHYRRIDHDEHVGRLLQSVAEQLQADAEARAAAGLPGTAVQHWPLTDDLMRLVCAYLPVTTTWLDALWKAMTATDNVFFSGDLYNVLCMAVKAEPAVRYFPYLRADTKSDATKPVGASDASAVVMKPEDVFRRDAKGVVAAVDPSAFSRGGVFEFRSAPDTRPLGLWTGILDAADAAAAEAASADSPSAAGASATADRELSDTVRRGGRDPAKLAPPLTYDQVLARAAKLPAPTLRLQPLDPAAMAAAVEANERATDAGRYSDGTPVPAALQEITALLAPSRVLRQASAGAAPAAAAGAGAGAGGVSTATSSGPAKRKATAAQNMMQTVLRRAGMGTRRIPFAPLREDNDAPNPIGGVAASLVLLSISAMREYANTSFDELRWQDHVVDHFGMHERLRAIQQTAATATARVTGPKRQVILPLMPPAAVVLVTHSAALNATANPPPPPPPAGDSKTSASNPMSVAGAASGSAAAAPALGVVGGVLLPPGTLAGGGFAREITDAGGPRGSFAPLPPLQLFGTAPLQS